jgi:hypothetical protein
MDESPTVAPRFHVPYLAVARTLMVLGIAALVVLTPGCGGGTSGDEGTVDLVKAQEAAASNPAIAKKAARLSGGLTESPKKKATKAK